MLDIKTMIQDLDAVKKNLAAKNMTADPDKCIALHQSIKESKQKLESLNKRKNEIAGLFPKATPEEKQKLKEETDSIKSELAGLGDAITALEAEYRTEMYRIPNFTAPEVPQGKTDHDNAEIYRFLEPTQFDFKPLDHVELGKKLDLIEFDRAAEVTGAKFYFLRNEAVLLELALTRFAMEIARKHGFTLMKTPDLARNEILRGSGFEPRGGTETQIYSIENTDLSLIGTSEITIGGFLAGQVLDISQLPVRISGFSHCYRTEAGSGGRESKGLYRVHQFDKIELYIFSAPEQSHDALEQLRAVEEEIYSTLGIPFRTVLVCTGDLGAPAYKKYDIEAWMPGRGDSGGYGEVTSCSNCTDFQSRRLDIKFVDKANKRREFVHTLNGTAIATSRTMIAVLENYQQADGSIKIPDALVPYTGFSVIPAR